MIFSLSLVSCVNNEGGITTNGNLNSNNPANTNLDPESSNQQVVTNQIVIDFENETIFSDYFSTNNTSNDSFTPSVFNSVLGSKTGKCTNTYNSGNSACNHTSIDTFNIPIKIEFEFFADDPYFTGSSVKLAIFEDDQNAIFSSLGSLTGGSDGYGIIKYRHTYDSSLGIPFYSKFLSGQGSFSEIDPLIDYNLGTQGKFSLTIDESGSYTLIFTKYDSSKAIIGTATYDGTLTTIPQSFKMQISTKNYSNSTYTSSKGRGEFMYIDNILIEGFN